MQFADHTIDGKMISVWTCGWNIVETSFGNKKENHCQLWKGLVICIDTEEGEMFHSIMYAGIIGGENSLCISFQGVLQRSVFRVKCGSIGVGHIFFITWSFATIICVKSNQSCWNYH